MGGRFFNGQMKEVRIWNAARTHAQIQAGMYGIVPTSSANLLAFYKLDEGTGTSVNDASAHYAAGSLVGAPSWVTATSPLTNSSFLWSPGSATTNSISATTAGNYTVAVTNANGCAKTAAATTVTVDPVVVLADNAQPNRLGYGLNFNGINNSVTATSTTLGNFGAGAFTVELWVKTSSTNNQNLINKRATCNNTSMWNLKLQGGFPLLEMNENTSGTNFFTLTANHAINDGTWHHITCTRSASGGIAKIYIDGVLSSTATGAIANISTTASLQIGSSVCNASNDGTKYFNGTLDEIRLWTVERSAAQIAASMNTALLGTETGLAVYYDCNQGTAEGANNAITTLTDKTAAANTATLSVTFAKTGTTSNFVSGAGALSVCIGGSTAAFTNSQAGGTWAIVNGTGSATVSTAGVVTGVSAGIVKLTYSYNNACGKLVTSNSVTVSPNNTASASSSSPTLCINTPLTNITHITTGATGIGTATGLPSGVTAAWASNTITISGTPTAGGIFSYSIPLTGGCGSVNATGTITVTPTMTASTASSSPSLCINTALTNITHITSGETGIVSVSTKAATYSLPPAVKSPIIGEDLGNVTISLNGSSVLNNTTSWNSLVGTIGTAAGTAGNYSDFTAFGPYAMYPGSTYNFSLSSLNQGSYQNAMAIYIDYNINGIFTDEGEQVYTAGALTSGEHTETGTFTIPTSALHGITRMRVISNNGSIITSPTQAVGYGEYEEYSISIGGTKTNYGLPTGVSASWTTNTITISGTPTVSGTFNYSIPLTGSCGTANATGTIISTPAVLNVSDASSTQTHCINTQITNIKHTTSGATGIGAAAGLPAGVIASWASNTITISGTPNTSGTFNYTIPLTGGCGNVNATGTITVTTPITVVAALSTPSSCINTPLPNISHSTAGATGIVPPSAPSYSLPLINNPTYGEDLGNVTISLNGSTILNNTTSVNSLSGTSGTASGTAGGYSDFTAFGPSTMYSGSTYSFSLSSVSNLGYDNFRFHKMAIYIDYNRNGLFTDEGEQVYTTNNRYYHPHSETGTFTIPVSASGGLTRMRVLCTNDAWWGEAFLTRGEYEDYSLNIIGGISGYGLPSGVTAAWDNNTITISGTPTESGTFNYNIPLLGACGSVNATGTITVNAINTVRAASSTPTVCINTPLTNITHSTSVATGIGTPTGLPSGVTAAWADNTITISGIPSASGTFNYSIPLTGGCGNVNATGTITVNALPDAGNITGVNSLCLGSASTFISSVNGGTWTIANNEIATINQQGVVNGVTQGSTTLNYTFVSSNGCSAVASKLITVEAAPVIPTLTGANSVCIGATINLTPSVTGGTWTTSAPIIATVTNGAVNGIVAGTTTISYKVGTVSCTSTGTRLITVEAAPVVTLSGSYKICALGKAIMKASVAGGVWGVENSALIVTSTQGFFRNPATPATDNFKTGITYTVKSALGACTTKARKTLIVRNVTGPTITVTAPKTSLKVNEIVTATATTPITATGVWSSLTTIVSATRNTLNTKTAAIKGLRVGTNANIIYYADDAATGCRPLNWLTFSVAAASSIVDVVASHTSQTDGVHIYPNPSNGKFTFENIDGATSVKLVDLSGRVIATQPINAGTTAVDFSGVATGKYMVHVTGASINEIQSVVIE